MLRSNRGTVAVGLCLVGVAGLIGRSFGQAPAQDAKVRPAAGVAGAPVTPPMPTSVTIGSIDMDAVLKGYDKFKATSEMLRAEAMERHAQLVKLGNEARQEGEKLSRLTPNGPDAKKCEDKITQLKAQFEAGRENAEREFTQKEAEHMATIYNEIQVMAKAIAKQRGMSFIVKYSDAPASGTEPNSVMAAMSRTILYADERVDVTKDVIYWLNSRYQTASGGAQPRPAAAPVAGAMAPAAAPRTAAPAPGRSAAGGPGGN